MREEGESAADKDRGRSAPERRWLLILALVAGLGAILILWLTRFGPGMSGDSTSYLMGAENLAAGRGFSRFSGGYEIKPITGFPPFYSVALAAFGRLGFGLAQTARTLNAGLFALILFVSAYLVFRHTRSGWAGLAAAALILTADSMLVWHSWIMSEGLYIGLLLSGLVLLLTDFEGRGRRWRLVLAGFCFAAATLTRYIGLGAIAGGVLAILLLRSGSSRRRLVDAGLLALSGLVPVAAWLGRNSLSAGTMTNRELALHPIDPELVRWYLAELSSWFVPHEVPLPTALRAALALGIVAALLGVFLWIQVRRGSLSKSWPWIRAGAGPLAEMPWIVALMLAAHLGVLAANSLFLDASTSQPAVARYLTPVFVLAVIFGAGVFASALRMSGARWGHRLGAAYAALLVGMYIVGASPLFQDPVAHMGYTAYRVRWGAVVDALRQVEAERPILTNNPELVYALADRPAYARPIRYDHYQQALREDFQSQLRGAKERLEAGGVFVVFHPVEAVDERTLEFTGAVELVSYDQATFYALPDEEPLP